MIRAALLSVLGLVAGMAGTVANAQFYVSPVGIYAPAPVVVVRPVYVSPVYASPVYSVPVVQPVYVSPISTVSYSTISSGLEPTPVYSEPATSYYQPAPVYAEPVYVSRPVYVAPAPVYVARSYYSPAVVHQSLRVGPYSATYRAHTHGFGSGITVRSHRGPLRSVTRVRAW